MSFDIGDHVQSKRDPKKHGYVNGVEVEYEGFFVYFEDPEPYVKPLTPLQQAVVDAYLTLLSCPYTDDVRVALLKALTAEGIRP